MKTNYLFPHKWKKIGWIGIVPSFFIGIFAVITDWEPELFKWNVPSLFPSGSLGLRGEHDPLFGMVSNNMLNEILGVIFIISAILVAFSKEKDEDEMSSKLRLESLVWATYWNYAILALSMLFVYDIAFYWIMLFNMFTILILFIIKYHWRLWSIRKSLAHEE